MAETRPGGLILAEFLQWLMAHPQHKRAAPSQSDIARKSGLSQSLVNKLLGGIHHAPVLDTYQKLTASYRLEWQDFLETHPRVREELSRAYGWATGHLEDGSPSDPQARSAQGYLAAIFQTGDETMKAMVVQLLRTQADFAQGPPPAKRKVRAAATAGGRRAS